MRAYFRVAPRFGVGMPWWMALPILLIWCAAAAAFWLGYALVMTVVIVVGAGREQWQAHQARALKKRTIPTRDLRRPD